MRAVKLVNWRRLMVSFLPTHVVVGVSLHTIQVGKYSQDLLRMLNVSVPFFYVTVCWRPRRAMRAAVQRTFERATRR